MAWVVALHSGYPRWKKEHSVTKDVMERLVGTISCNRQDADVEDMFLGSLPHLCRADRSYVLSS